MSAVHDDAIAAMLETISAQRDTITAQRALIVQLRTELDERADSLALAKSIIAADREQRDIRKEMAT